MRSGKEWSLDDDHGQSGCRLPAAACGPVRGMKLGRVIGRVVLNQTAPELVGARWLLVSPFTREHFQRGTETPEGMTHEPSLVVYDNIGGHVGQTIGYVEGREAAMPFDSPTPVDAINVALVDDVVYEPGHDAPMETPAFRPAGGGRT